MFVSLANVLKACDDLNTAFNNVASKVKTAIMCRKIVDQIFLTQKRPIKYVTCVNARLGIKLKVLLFTHFIYIRLRLYVYNAFQWESNQHPYGDNS